MDIPVNVYEPTELDAICKQLTSAMTKCPELTALLKRSVFNESFELRPGLVTFVSKQTKDSLGVQIEISERLRNIADAATRLAEWEPGSPSGLQKSEALLLLSDLTSPKESASAAARIERAVSRSGRFL